MHFLLWSNLLICSDKCLNNGHIYHSWSLPLFKCHLWDKNLTQTDQLLGLRSLESHTNRPIAGPQESRIHLPIFCLFTGVKGRVNPRAQYSRMAAYSVPLNCVNRLALAGCNGFMKTWGQPITPAATPICWTSSTGRHGSGRCQCFLLYR